MECRLDVVAGYKSGRSYMKKFYVGRPFRIVSVGQRKMDNKLYQMIMTSSPGILDGDDYVINIDLEEHAELQLQVQSYQRLYNMDEGASQHLTVKMADHTSFAYVPHPTVPYEESTYKSEVNLTLGEDSQLVYGEIITCGRKYHGEVFKLKHYHSTTQVFYKNRLVVKDNVLIQPDLIPISSIGILENYTHQGSLVFYSSKADVDKKALVNLFLERAEKHHYIEVGISALEGDGFMVRALGQGGDAIHRYFIEIQDYLWDMNPE